MDFGESTVNTFKRDCSKIVSLDFIFLLNFAGKRHNRMSHPQRCTYSYYHEVVLFNLPFEWNGIAAAAKVGLRSELVRLCVRQAVFNGTLILI